jgi:outer membrane receptor protein involved in Fe transport
MSGPPPSRAQAPFTPTHGGWLRFLSIAAIVLALWPVGASAEESTEPVQLAQAEAPAAGELEGAIEEEELEPVPRSRAIAPPPDIEVFRIKGRGVAAIETDVPESVTQFDAAAIEALGAQNISDLAKVTPNVEIRTAGATAATFFIRGVGLSDFSANAAGAVAIYQDDVSFNAPALQLGQLFDLENVDVRRGPQGTGSGRNASAGAIKIYSRKPTGETSAELRASLGRYQSTDAYHAFIQDYEGALEVPLVEEMLAARLAFRFRDADPFMKNGCGNAPPVEERVARPHPIFDAYVGNELVIEAEPNTSAFDPRWSQCAEGVDETTIRFVPEYPGRAQITSLGVSHVPAGLPARVGDQGNWAARGQLRFQPPGTDMDWLLNAHGSRLDQQSTLGQAMGTTGFLGDQTVESYVEPDQQEELCGLQGGVYNSAFNSCDDWSVPVEDVQALLEENLAEDRPLDIDPFRGDYNRVGRTTLDTWGGFVRGDFSLGPVDVTSISGYDAYNRFRDTDQDFTPDVLFEAIREDEAWQFFHELKLSGELPDAPLRWEAGGYYLMEELDAFNEQDIWIRFGNFTREYSQDTWSFALHAGFSWDFLDDFTLEGGVRYNWSRKKFDLEQERTELPGLPTARSFGEETWDAPTGTISLRYHFNEDASAYWKYSRGFKPGHYNSNTAEVDPAKQEAEPAKPEYIDSFETGLRGRWWDGRLGLGVALFYYKYADYQVFLFEDNPASPPTLEIVNASDAEVYGGELDFRLEPFAGWLPDTFDGLVITGRFGWLESQFLDFTNTVFRVAQTGETVAVVVDYSGNQLINSPRFKASGAAEWTFDLGRWGSIIPRYDFAWTDDVFYDPSEGRGSLGVDGQPNKPEYTVGQRAFWLHNLRLAYRTPEGNIEIAAWVRNLEDQRYKSYAFDASGFSKAVINFVGQPRTIGLDLSISW